MSSGKKLIKYPINKENCRQLTGWEPALLVQMTGIEGYTTEYTFEIEGHQFAVRVTVNSNNKIVHLRRTFLPEEMVVENDRIEILTPNKKIGPKIFARQVEHCSERGFKAITCIAAHVPFNGYYTWARFGYIMDEEMQPEMDRHLKERHFKGSERTPHEIVLNPAYRKWWKKNGIGWTGTFSLTDGSESLRIFEQYKKEKL